MSPTSKQRRSTFRAFRKLGFEHFEPRILLAADVAVSSSTQTNIPGDFDLDLEVDGADFLIWQRGFNQFSGDAIQTDGDADGDGFVDGDDLSIWKANLGISPPTVNDDEYSTDEDVQLVVDAVSGVLDNDTDNNLPANLTAVLLTDVANGTLNLNADGSFDYTPALDFNGQDSFTYHALDGGSGATAVGTVTLTVNSLNDAPSITSDGGGATAALNVVENTTVVTDVNASDPEGQTEAGGGLTYALSGLDAALFSIDAAGTLAFLAAPDFEAPADVGSDNVYDVTVTVTDTGSLTAMQDLAVTVTPDSAGGPTSDDFSSGILNPALWSFVNPLGDAMVQLTGAGTADARLEIYVPGGASHEPWDVNFAPRVMQPTENIDFELEVKFESPLTLSYQEQGIIVEQDGGNYLRFDLSYGSGTFAFAASITNSSATTKFSVPITVTSPMYMRVTRVGDQWTMSYSDDGASWNVAGSFVRALTVTEVGVFGGNYSSTSAPAHTTLVDYFFETSTRIIPEDGGVNGNPLVATPIADLAVTEDAADTVLDLSDTFSDPDMGDLLTLTIEGNTNPSLVTASLLGTTLTLSYAPGMGGSANITIRATDDGSLYVEDTFEVTVLPPDPVIDIWYGTDQQFGQPGVSQVWVNILGNVRDADGLSSLTYSLNGGGDVNLQMGPDALRLQSPGDFNVDIAVGDLIVGQNQVVITAVDTLSNMSSATVNLDYSDGNSWPIPYTVDWNTVTDIQDAAQVVDGDWEVTGDTVTAPAISGYDRLLAIGDLNWTDYEVVVPVTITGNDFNFNPCLCNAIGFGLRWQGHVVDGKQPSAGVNNYGALALYRWDGSGSTERLWLASKYYVSIVEDTSGKTFLPDLTYIFKARAETTPSPGGSLYSFKVWREGDPEPVSWDLTMQTGAEDNPMGSILLLSHYTNATFGSVTVTPLAIPATSSSLAAFDPTTATPLVSPLAELSSGGDLQGFTTQLSDEFYDFPSLVDKVMTDDSLLIRDVFPKTQANGLSDFGSVSSSEPISRSQAEVDKNQQYQFHDESLVGLVQPKRRLLADVESVTDRAIADDQWRVEGTLLKDEVNLWHAKRLVDSEFGDE